MSTPEEEFAKGYIRDVIHAMTDKRAKTIIFSHNPTLRVVPETIRAAHLDSLVRPFGEAYGRKFRTLYKTVGEERDKEYGEQDHPDQDAQSEDEKDFPTVRNVMPVTSWERVLLRSGAYQNVSKDQVVQLVRNIRKWQDGRRFELRLVSDAVLEATQKLALRTRAWETIARVGKEMAIYRAWDLSLWYTGDVMIVNNTDTLLQTLWDLAETADLDRYETWAEKARS